MSVLMLTSVFVMSACDQQQSEPVSSASSSSASSGASPSSSASPSPSGTANPVEWEDNATVSHLFFHSLVVDPDRAFDGDAEAAGYLDYMVTIDEFNEILEQLLGF